MTVPARLVTRVEVVVLRTLMIVMAAGTAFTGAMLLTTPLAIPAVIVLWLGAVSMFGLGVWGKLPEY